MPTQRASPYSLQALVLFQRLPLHSYFSRVCLWACQAASATVLWIQQQQQQQHANSAGSGGMNGPGSNVASGFTYTLALATRVKTQVGRATTARFNCFLCIITPDTVPVTRNFVPFTWLHSQLHPLGSSQLERGSRCQNASSYTAPAFAGARASRRNAV